MKTITGDLIQLALDGEFDVIVHGCNCQCMMGAGIAKQIAEAFPEAVEADALTEKGSKTKLGYISYADHYVGRRRFFIVNAYTQWRYGRGVQVDYDAIRLAMREVKKHFSGGRIGYPKIGAGLGGGDWDRIAAIIDEELEDEDHTLVVYKRRPIFRGRSLVGKR
jgi:O-acetyl-ADP-ribose deacetylase (regulator of RNase III)